MKLSAYFRELSKSYAYEIEDLTYDSGGVNVLNARLKVKREQFKELLPMIDFEPVMVSPAFHKAFHFTDKAAMENLVSAKPGSFPTWKALAATLTLQPWAENMAQTALKSEGGAHFMLLTAGLEFILSGLGAAAATGEAEQSVKESDGEDDEDKDPGEEGEDRDLGEDYLSDQGFDRRG